MTTFEDKYEQTSFFMEENPKFLSEQIITYLGNKRALLDFIDIAIKEVCKELGKDKLDIVDIFSGSGIVSRFMKKYSKNLYVNDLEDYCETINKCELLLTGRRQEKTNSAQR